MPKGTRAQLPFDAYRGDDAYFFASYSHEDADLVYPELIRLREEGFNVWYDEGISPGHAWPEELANKIERCALFVLFVSPRAVASENCTRETNFALARHKPILAVHLEETDLPSGLELSIGDRQAIIRPHLDEQAYRHKLTDAITEHVPLYPPAASPETVATIAVDDARPTRRRSAFLSAVAVVIAIVAIGIYQNQEGASGRRVAIEQGLPEAERLEAQDRYVEAFVKAVELEKVIPDHPRLAALWPKISVTGSLLTDPAGADVSYRGYASPREEWIHIGQTPIENVRLPRGTLVVRTEKAGFASVESVLTNPGFRLGNFRPGMPSFAWPLSEPLPTGQVFVPGIRAPIFMAGFDWGGVPHELGAFLIDSHEVTNAQFKEFVDAGGYEQRGYWEGLAFRDEDGDLTWERAIETFVDSTGRPGPATWELGSHPVGQADWPASGVSWYEAVAYARFRGRDLPTRYHWARAATMGGIGVDIVSMSNFDGEGTAPAGRYAGVGPFGTYDMAGNVREWVRNEQDARRLILGGAWNDARYMFTLPNSLPPLDRSSTNGFRTVEYLGDGPAEEHIALFETDSRDLSDLKPLGDEGYATLVTQFDYTRSPSRGAEVTASRESPRGWRRETVRIRSAYVEDGFIVHLYFPLDAKPAVQPVIFVPGIFSFETDIPSESDALLELPFLRELDFVIGSGRALIWPVYQGSYERYDELNELSGAARANASRLRRVRWQSDVGEVIDYLETRGDIAGDKTALLGYSYGGTVAPQILALEDRIKAAILIAGGAPAESTGRQR